MGASVPSVICYNIVTMSAYDRFHTAVRNALIRDGWIITDDTLKVELDGDRLYIDLGAERVIAAEKGTQKIAVEVKTFGGPSKMADLGQAIGQYILYRVFLRRIEPDRDLYLAVPQDVLEDLFQKQSGRGFVEDEQARVFGYDSVNEVIVQWLP
jgi:hypothetical protein